MSNGPLARFARRRRSRPARQGGWLLQQLKDGLQLNVLQVILRDHGFERVEDKHDDWSVFWCAGQVEPGDLCTSCRRR